MAKSLFTDTLPRAIEAAAAGGAAGTETPVEKGTGKPGDRKGKRRASGFRGGTSVVIKKVEVVADDPDRFAFNFVRALEDVNNSGTQAIKSVNDK